LAAASPKRSIARRLAPNIASDLGCRSPIASLFFYVAARRILCLASIRRFAVATYPPPGDVPRGTARRRRGRVSPLPRGVLPPLPPLRPALPRVCASQRVGMGRSEEAGSERVREGPRAEPWAWAWAAVRMLGDPGVEGQRGGFRGGEEGDSRADRVSSEGRGAKVQFEVPSIGLGVKTNSPHPLDARLLHPASASTLSFSIPSVLGRGRVHEVMRQHLVTRVVVTDLSALLWRPW